MEYFDTSCPIGIPIKWKFLEGSEKFDLIALDLFLKEKLESDSKNTIELSLIIIYTEYFCR